MFLIGRYNENYWKLGDEILNIAGTITCEERNSVDLLLVAFK